MRNYQNFILLIGLLVFASALGVAYSQYSFYDRVLHHWGPEFLGDNIWLYPQNENIVRVDIQSVYESSLTSIQMNTDNWLATFVPIAGRSGSLYTLQLPKKVIANAVYRSEPFTDIGITGFRSVPISRDEFNLRLASKVDLSLFHVKTWGVNGSDYLANITFAK
jgi:hypothetical protein